MSGAVAYTTMQVEEDSGNIIIKHIPLVKRIAFHLKGRLPDSIAIDDLIQTGMVGLLEAAKKYDASLGASFDTYAGIRIRGAMLDEVRRLDWTPRSVHQKSRMVSEAINEIENKLGRDAKASDITEHLGLTSTEYNKILQDSQGCRTFSVEELSEAADPILESGGNVSPEPLGELSKDNFKDALAVAIEQLPEREKLVVSLYYEEELNLREIGEVLGVTESRVSQISSQAMIRLRSKLSDWLENKKRA